MTNNNSLNPLDILFGARPMAPRPSFPRLGNMATDIHEKDGKVIVDMEIPGADPDSFDITFEGDELRVVLEKRSERSSEDGRYSERTFGTYSRVIHLGENVDGDAIEAEYTDGVLTITAPRTESAQPKRIQVKSAGKPVGEVESTKEEKADESSTSTQEDVPREESNVASPSLPRE